MPRLREFDTDDVLDAAMATFWRQGFEATSIEDLVSATGLSRASMYHAFGSKEGLFLATLDHYIDNVNRKRLALLADPVAPRQAIHRFFDNLVEFSAGDGRWLGCLLTNSAIELGPKSRDVELKLVAAFDRVERALEDAIRRAQAAGEISGDKDPVGLARFLMSTINGLRVMARSRPDKERLRDVATLALQVLD